MVESLMDSSQLISILWQRHGTVVFVILYLVHAIKRQGSWITPAHLPSLRGCPVPFLERLAASAVLGFEPRTFGSGVPSFAHIATEAARLLPAKLSLILLAYCYSGFA